MAIVLGRRGGGGNVGSQPTLASVTITSAQLLAFDVNTPATWPEVLPPLTGRNYYVVVYPVVMHFRAGETPYDAAVTNAQLYDITGLIPYSDMVASLDLTAEEDTYTIANAVSVTGTPYANASASDVEGAAAAVYWIANETPTSGDGELTLRVWYVVVDGA